MFVRCRRAPVRRGENIFSFIPRAEVQALTQSARSKNQFARILSSRLLDKISHRHKMTRPLAGSAAYRDCRRGQFSAGATFRRRKNRQEPRDATHLICSCEARTAPFDAQVRPTKFGRRLPRDRPSAHAHLLPRAITDVPPQFFLAWRFAAQNLRPALVWPAFSGVMRAFSTRAAQTGRARHDPSRQAGEPGPIAGNERAWLLGGTRLRIGEYVTRPPDSVVAEHFRAVLHA